MKIAAWLNPVRHLAGRVFLWFWLTFIITAVVAVWLSRMLTNELTLATPEAGEREGLASAVALFGRAEQRGAPIERALERANRHGRGFILLVDTQSGELIRGGGPPFPPHIQDDIAQVAKQSEALVLKRGRMRIIGPQRITYNGQPYAVFVSLPGGRPRDNIPLWSIILLALCITGLLAYGFARSLTRPISRLRSTTRALAKGNWHARVADDASRSDEIGQLARDFNLMADKLERQWQEQKRLMADVSHELRSPLARLQMTVGLAAQQNLAPEVFERVEREASRMDDLIARLLQLSRAEAGNYSPQKLTTQQLFASLIADMTFEAEHHHKRFVVVSMDNFTIEADSTLLLAAVENVCRNALRYAASTVSLWVKKAGTEWVITVRDDGPGLTAEQCARIFDPFYRVSAGRERETGGIGLGLAIAKAAVALHHGSICAMPEKPGLSVIFTLPLDAH